MECNTSRFNNGFALLLTLLVITVVVSITATIIELTIKQLNLSVTAKDSEVAFHAANAGMECVQYVRRTSATAFENGNNSVTVNCMGRSQTFVEVNPPAVLTDRPGTDVYRYHGIINWLPTGTSNNRCSVVDMVVIVNNEIDDTEPARVTSNLENVFPGFSGVGQFEECDPQSTCTIAGVAGYNSACNATSTSGVVRREILLDF